LGSKVFVADPGAGAFLTRDGKIFGSGINIPDPQHCLTVKNFSPSLYYRTEALDQPHIPATFLKMYTKN
jgi:hypothetical protein